MRTRLILVLVAGLLFCTLSTLELPEFLTLTDDTSNDFMLTDVQDSAPVVVEKELQRSEVEATKVGREFFPVALPAAPLQQAPSPISDLLPSLCTWRT